jgi:hypothetical protein
MNDDEHEVARAWVAFYESLDALAAWGTPEFNRRYEQQMAEAIAHLGADADCRLIDPELWTLYSDLHKDDHGIRPRPALITRAEAQAWIDKRKG